MWYGINIRIDKYIKFEIFQLLQKREQREAMRGGGIIMRKLQFTKGHTDHRWVLAIVAGSTAGIWAGLASLHTTTHKF